MLSASTLGSADDTYLDLDYSGYQKSLIQHVISRKIEFYNTIWKMKNILEWDKIRKQKGGGTEIENVSDRWFG